MSEIEAMKLIVLTADQPTIPKTTGPRQAGGGRKKIEDKDETLLPDLLTLVTGRWQMGSGPVRVPPARSARRWPF